MRWTKFALAASMLAVSPAPVLAQAAPAAPAAPAVPSVPLATLLDAGYEIRTVIQLTSDEQKSIWPNDAVSAFSMLVLQKGTSIAVCSMPTASLIHLDTNVSGSVKLCKTR